MKSDLRLILPVVLALVVAAGCQQKKGAAVDSSSDLDSAAAIEDSVAAVDETRLILDKYRAIDFEDTLQDHKTDYTYNWNYIVDTIIAEYYIRYGIVKSTATEDTIRKIGLNGADTIYAYFTPGNIAKIFINPIDKYDALIIDRDLIHDNLDIHHYYDSLKSEMCIFAIDFKETRQDTIIFHLHYFRSDTDQGLYPEFKVIKEDGKYLFWTRDASDDYDWEMD